MNIKHPIIIIFLLFISPWVFPANSPVLFDSMATDTLPPPPPGSNFNLTGPAIACVGDTSIYSVEIPIACECEWSVNGAVQPGTTSPLVVSWTQPGLQVIGLTFICSNGQTPVGQVETAVSEPPGQPGNIQGETSVCEFTIHTYTTSVGPFDTCEWKVNGAVQPATGPSMTYSFGAAGIYTLEVTARNNCGTSPTRTQEVVAQGTAPPPPDPLTGPDQSCTGYTETYIASPAPGYSCLWWVDGMQQPDTSDQIMITWQQTGPHLVEARTFSECGTSNPAQLGVMVYATPIVDLGPDTAIMQGATITLDAGNTGSNYLWSTGATTQTIEVMLAGTYSVTVDNYCGSDWDDIEVSVITGMNELEDGFSGLIRYDGSRLYIDQGNDQILSLQILNSSGALLYEGPFKAVHNIQNKGLLIIILKTSKSVYYKKIIGI